MTPYALGAATAREWHATGNTTDIPVPPDGVDAVEWIGGFVDALIVDWRADGAMEAAPS